VLSFQRKRIADRIKLWFDLVYLCIDYDAANYRILKNTIFIEYSLYRLITGKYDDEDHNDSKVTMPMLKFLQRSYKLSFYILRLCTNNHIFNTFT